MMKAEVVTFGETMVLFDPSETGKLRYVERFVKRIGGAESNLAIGLQKLGHATLWMSKVGADELGTYVTKTIRAEGVNTDYVKRTAEAPTGMYIKEKVRPEETKVYYYRHGSAASQFTAEDLEIDKIREARILHITGITPLLSKSCEAAVRRAIDVAKENEVLISFDPNLRHTLIQKYGEQEAKTLLCELAAEADLVMPGLDEAVWMYGLNTEEEMAEHLLKQGPKQVVLKNGADYSFFAEKDGESGRVDSYKVKQVVDAIGAGDGFAAGVLSGLLEGQPLNEAVRLGSAVGALVVSSAGDVEGLPDREEVDAYMNKIIAGAGGVLR
ncbi:sugar kinase [Shouchella shacheensis]|uniref:sugar kinase n=1 Tax=Shouchella shacheensis TaxID=1649580 RepID=UPI00073FF7AB|nr:sugar kinase [Shouchella shacheensis]